MFIHKKYRYLTHRGIEREGQWVEIPSVGLGAILEESINEKVNMKKRICSRVANRSGSRSYFKNLAASRPL